MIETKCDRMKSFKNIFQNRTGSIFILLFFTTVQVFGTEFDSARAWEYLQKQCSFGPRPPGSKAHRKCLDYLEMELKKYSSSVQRQSFLGVNPVSGETYTMHNLIAGFWPERSRRVMLCAHWDTRPWADRDPDPANRDQPILGANDGASGVAILLEIARCLAEEDPGIGVDVVLFDGEDMGREGHLDEYCLGSHWYARHLRFPLPEAVVLLDMVGDADLRIAQELYSRMTSPELLSEIFAVAEQLGESAFDPRPGHAVYDDHVALLNEGIQAVNLIDFDFDYWHTVKDVPEYCSPESLGTVGRVVLTWLYQRGGRP